uniref:Putative secreted peptide n=1 Tax=Anopheles braziliensis TaxID=58242 RepID=A0A2M3ZQX8_9DIPT
MVMYVLWGLLPFLVRFAIGKVTGRKRRQYSVAWLHRVCYRRSTARSTESARCQELLRAALIESTKGFGAFRKGWGNVKLALPFANGTA